MDRNRPQGREKYVTNNSTGIHKRGSGLNTGPVGSGTGPNGGSQSTQKRASGSYGTSSGSGRKKPLIAIIAAIIALAGGGGLLGSGVLSGGGDVAETPSAYTQSYTQDTNQSTTLSTPQASSQSASSGGTSGSLNSAIESILGGSTSSGWSDQSNSAQLSSSVASGSRSKYPDPWRRSGHRQHYGLMCGARSGVKKRHGHEGPHGDDKGHPQQQCARHRLTGGASGWTTGRQRPDQPDLRGGGRRPALPCLRRGQRLHDDRKP